ncbi:GntR family transcriptional regulator [Pontibacillus yanchengensis]|uniref:Transcriptional regulator n=1 Tax=Pontibacillus yanchengensis Y32 TaxID=1385514 RepID=A0A0A2TGA4_9BACI|nr:GntR family transcriptional regulator [Pontibacillus yanchengensis]KGP74594.1 transcriptional regulator [Pontibacillus yanchengensis Y32]
MPQDFQKDKPIYLQLMTQLSSEIIRGERKAGDKLPSVREYAIEAGVNPNTMSKTYKELESMGVVEFRRGQGTFVTEDYNRLEKLRTQMKEEYIESFIKDMKELGFSAKETLDGLQSYYEKEDDG